MNVAANTGGDKPRKSRAAVIIGIDRTGGMQPLQACAEGAAAVADWLADDYDVELLTDAEDRLVTCAMVQAAIKSFVDAGTYQQLVLFFSGHGLWKNMTELWLLTNAPADPNEAISWTETMELAKDCGIPHVVLISDACRSIPNTVQAQRVRGSLVFPNTTSVGPNRSTIDKFLGSSVGTAAYELSLEGGSIRTSVFTHCLLDSFRNINPDSVAEVTEAGQLVRVIPNRRLARELKRRVPQLVQDLNITLDQQPDAEIVSDDNVYIGKVGDNAGQVPLEPPIPPARVGVPSLKDLASVTLKRELLLEKPLMGAAPDDFSPEAQQLEAVIGVAAQTAEVSHFETETGVTVVGTAVRVAAGQAFAECELLTAGGASDPALIKVRLSDSVPACNVAIQFVEGSGTVVAAIRGYIAHVVVEDAGVVNVNYVPSSNTWMWEVYQSHRESIERLRAVTAAAARKNIFRLETDEKAEAFARKARVFKGYDPSLGLYASYAYSQADRRSELASVLELMSNDLDILPFDVAMLNLSRTGELETAHEQTARAPKPFAQRWWRDAQYDAEIPPIYPFCPALTQGWNFIRAKNVRLPRVLIGAENELVPALWTTFRSKRMDRILKAIGELR